MTLDRTLARPILLYNAYISLHTRWPNVTRNEDDLLQESEKQQQVEKEGCCVHTFPIKIRSRAEICLKSETEQIVKLPVPRRPKLRDLEDYARQV